MPKWRYDFKHKKISPNWRFLAEHRHIFRDMMDTFSLNWKWPEWVGRSKLDFSDGLVQVLTI